MATNTLGNYNEVFFVQEALIQLQKALGLAGRVFRGIEQTPQQRGDTIKLRRPATFTAQDAPSVDQNVTTESVSLVLDQWKEVKFSLTDKDLSLSAPQIITDHIRPAAYALADKVDQTLAALYTDIPWYTVNSSTPALADITAAKKVLFDNGVPQNDGKIHYMIGSAEQAAYQNALTVLANPQADGLRTGSLGVLYGVEVFANQNVVSHTSGVGADAVGTVDGVNAVGATTVLFSAVTAGITWKKGDSFSIAGDAQRYVATANGTDADGSAASITFSPGLKIATAGTEVITLFLGGSAKRQNVMFHENAFCLGSAPLISEPLAALGVKVATVADPVTGLALRSRIFAMPDASAVKVALDILFGVKTLDPNLALRAYQN